MTAENKYARPPSVGIFGVSPIGSSPQPTITAPPELPPAGHGRIVRWRMRLTSAERLLGSLVAGVASVLALGDSAHGPSEHHGIQI